MPAEGRPHGEPDSSLLARALAGIARFVVRFPVATLALAVGLAAAALVITGTRLGYKSSRLDLLNPHSDYNRLWIEYIDEFGNDDDAVVVVEGPSREHVVPVLEELSRLLARDNRLFDAVLHERDLSQLRERIRAKGLHFLTPQELEAMERMLDESIGIVGGQWSRLKVGAMIQTLTGQIRQQNESRPVAPLAQDRPANAEAARGAAGETELSSPVLELQWLTSSLLTSLREQGTRYQSPWPGMPASLVTISELCNEYLLTDQGRLGFVLLRLAEGDDKLAPRSEAIDVLRRLIADLRLRHPDTQIGLTGLPIMENDEMRASQSSMIWASVLSFVGVAPAVRGGVRRRASRAAGQPGAAGRHGLGLWLRHADRRPFEHPQRHVHRHADRHRHRLRHVLRRTLPAASPREARLRRALVETSRAVGPSISTGAITTAIAFFAAGLTSFTGVAELGIIAGGGTAACALAAVGGAAGVHSSGGSRAAASHECPSRWPCTRGLAR